LTPAVGVYDTVSTPEVATLDDVPGQLIVSVSGIRDSTTAAADEFSTLLDAREVPVSFLVAPRLAGNYRLTDDNATAEWLRRRREHGDAIVLHGFDAAAIKKRRPEFAALPAHEANLRLKAADRVLEQIGLRTRLFAPPGWLASAGTVEALPRNGFRLLASMAGITDLVRGTTSRARVIGIGAGFLTEPWWCRTVVLSAQRVARRGGIVRIAVSAKQLSRSGPRQAMIDAVDLALMHGATPTVYRWHPNRLLDAA
jgi:uncharacterized protein